MFVSSCMPFSVLCISHIPLSLCFRRNLHSNLPVTGRSSLWTWPGCVLSCSSTFANSVPEVTVGFVVLSRSTVMPMRSAIGKNYSSSGWKGPQEICSPAFPLVAGLLPTVHQHESVIKRRENRCHHWTKWKSCVQDLKTHDKTFILNRNRLEEKGDRHKSVCRPTWTMKIRKQP